MTGLRFVLCAIKFLKKKKKKKKKHLLSYIADFLNFYIFKIRVLKAWMSELEY